MSNQIKKYMTQQKEKNLDKKEDEYNLNFVISNLFMEMEPDDFRRVTRHLLYLKETDLKGLEIVFDHYFNYVLEAGFNDCEEVVTDKRYVADGKLNSFINLVINTCKKNKNKYPNGFLNDYLTVRYPFETYEGYMERLNKTESLLKQVMNIQLELCNKLVNRYIEKIYDTKTKTEK